MDSHTSHDNASPDGLLYRRKLILKIRSYATAFPKEVGHQVAAKDLENLGENQLESLLQEIKFTVGSRSTSIVTNQAAAVSLLVLEDWLKENMNKEVSGPEIRLSQLMNSEDCQYLVKELSLEYADFVYQRPEARMAMYLFNAVQTIDGINRKALEGAVKPPPVGDKRKEPDTPPAQTDGQPTPTQRPRTEGPDILIEELPVAAMPPPPSDAVREKEHEHPVRDNAVVRPAVLRNPPPVAKPKPAPRVFAIKKP